jgi:hypothetical protein
MIQIMKGGLVVATSNNLRGLFTYSQNNIVERVDINGPDVGGRARLTVTWRDGATCKCDFASFHVCSQWVKARRMFEHAKIWYAATINEQTESEVQV